MDYTYAPGRSHLFVPGPVNIPEQVLCAMKCNNEDYRSPAIPALTKTLIEDARKSSKPLPALLSSSLPQVNSACGRDRVVSFLLGQFSLLWIDQQQRLRFNVDVIESDWGYGADLNALASKLASDHSQSIKAVRIVHIEWVSDTVTTVMVPPYIDSSEVVKRGWKRYNLSLGLGLNKVSGKVFRIGHLGNLNELQLLGCLAGVEMVLKDVGYPVKLGSGVAAAASFLGNTTPLIPSRI